MHALYLFQTRLSNAVKYVNVNFQNSLNAAAFVCTDILEYFIATVGFYIEKWDVYTCWILFFEAGTGNERKI